jgi:hypothetical protein
MPNDFSSLWSSSRRSAGARRVRGRPAPRIVEGNHQLAARARWAALAALALIALPGCGGEEDTEVTYNDDVRRIFNRRCTTCHESSTPIGVDIVDIQNPFAPERGLVFAPNSWAAPDAYPGLTPAQNVVPFEPENSFLLDKITGDLPPDGGGAAMPLQVSPLDANELAVVEQWVTDGAQDNTFFRENVRPIFGSEDSTGAYINGKCIFCHYTGSPNPLDLSNPFDPQNGLVNVPATYRGDMVRVQPGSPDDSLLILKVRAQRPESDIGAQMPYSFTKLTASQIDIVRQWIVEGARP